MNLLEIREQYEELKRQAGSFIGMKYLLPLSEIENTLESEKVCFTVVSIDIAENSVELEYLDLVDNESMTADISMDKLYSLAYEPFLPSNKASMPDVDVDVELSADCKEEVIAYVKANYGLNESSKIQKILNKSRK